MAPVWLAFGTPEHGWLDVALDTPDEQRLTYSVSDVPVDSLLHLAEAALRTVRRWSEEETVAWSLEPGYWLWTWRTDGDTLELAISDHAAQKPESTDTVRAPVSDLISAISHALTSLEQDTIWKQDTDYKTWSWPFPSREAAALRAEIATGGAARMG